MAASSAMILSGVAAQPGVVALRGHVPAVVSRLQPNGQLPGATEMKLAIGLPLRNQAALTNLLQQLYDPSSPNYRHYLTPEEFTAQFGPTEQDYQKVINFAQASGLQVTQTHSNRMLVDVSGNVADIEKAFHVALRTYQHPAEARNFFAPDAEPTVAGDLPVLHVSGLDNYVIPRPALHIASLSSAKPGAGSGPSGSYLGYDFRNAYAPGATQTGSGQMVGLLEFDAGFYQSDITAYEIKAGLPNVPVQAVLLDGYDGSPGSILANGEVSLDIEMAIAMAPGLSAVYVFEGTTTDDILNAMAASYQIKQLSASWGYTIDATTEQIFKQFAAQGQSFLNCSGDGLAWAGPIFTPCDDPYITVVGGTTLTMTNNTWASETVWNWGFTGQQNDWNVDQYWGSSGGISTTYSIPSWQTNINMTANRGSTTFRNVPDVALTADNIFIVCNGGNDGISGGTSAATPLWAGFMALINQQAVANGRPTLGFLNPTIYALAKGTNYPSLFHDITTGNNYWPGSPNKFPAVPGYDLCTGWGTPNGTNLITALGGAPVVPVSAPLPPYGTNFAVLNGGNPNGAWDLFVQDDAPLDTGTVYNGWILNLTLASPVIGAADNQLLMTSVATNVPFGSNIVYILSVTNYGPSPSTNVLVSDTLPLNVTLVSSNFTAGSLNGTRWSVGSLAVNAGATLTFTLHPTASGNFTNSATVSAVTPDPNPDDISASAIVTVGSGSPQLTGGVAIGNGVFQFSVTSGANQTNVIQVSTNLVNWVPIYTNVGPFTFTNAILPGHPVQFYRDFVLGP
ncbi:MAG: protease pro-enzyme activation domain-containing protein [Verrucomicrobiota bacterium]